MRRICVGLVLVGLTLCLPHRALAQAQPLPKLHVDLSLEPSGGGLTGALFGPRNGLAIYFGEGGGDSVESFGIGLGIGFLLNRHIELGAMLDLGVIAAADSDTIFMFGLRPMAKFNLWATRHVNPFFQPFVGFLTADFGADGGSTTVFDGGFYLGVEFLVTTWGIRLYTGFEALKKEHVDAQFTVPIKWALVAYF